MAFDKTNLAPGQTARSSDVLQLVNALDGTANYGQPITLNKLNSNSAYALDVQNLGTGGGFRVKSTGGATLLDVTDSGVSYTLAAITVPSSAGAAPTGEGVMEWDSDDDLLKVGTGAATKVLVDTTATQTLTNKTLTAPTLTTVTVSSGGMVVTGDSSAIRQVTSTQPILQFQPVDDLNPNNVAFGVTNAAVGAYTFSVNKNGGTIIAAGGLTVSAGGLTVTAGGVGVNRTPLTNAPLALTQTYSLTAAAESYGLHLGGTVTVASGTTAQSAAGYFAPAVTVASGATLSKFSNVLITEGAMSNAGTFTAHYMLDIEQPTGASSNVVIRTASGATLTTAGVWTDNPSWAALKTAITPVERTEVTGLLDWLRDDYQPVRYRYATTDGPYDQPDAYDHFGYLLDDLPPHVREIVCADAQGGISGKDERGLLLALVQECAHRIAALEAAGQKGAN